MESLEPEPSEVLLGFVLGVAVFVILWKILTS